MCPLENIARCDKLQGAGPTARRADVSLCETVQDFDQSVKCITCFSAGAKAAQAFFMGS